MTNYINFWSGKNYMERTPICGTVQMSPPTTERYGVFYVSDTTIAHNLGFVPFFMTYYEPFGDSVIWPNMGTRAGGSVTNPNNSSQLGPCLISWADSTNLYLELVYYTNTLTGTFPVYYITYYNYGL